MPDLANGGPGARGRSYMFLRVTRKGKPGQEAWAVYRRLDGSEATVQLRLGDPGLRGGFQVIETEFETEKGDVGLDESAVGRAGITTSPCACSVPAGPAAGLGGKRCPESPVPRCTGCMLERFGPEELLLWLEDYATSGRAAPTRDAGPEGRMERRCRYSVNRSEG